MRQFLPSSRPRATPRLEQLEDRSTPAATFADLATTEAFAADRVLVSFAEGQGSAKLLESAYAETVTPLGFDIYRVELLPFVAVADAIGFYTAQPDVVAAEPDRIVTVNATLNDPQLSSQYALTTTNTTTAWNRTTGTRNAVVAVIDTGIDYTHPDLAANLWVNAREVAGNGRDDDGNGFTDDVIGYDFANNDADPMDDDRHGTHVAGIIGATGNNGVGISGVNPNTRIMALKFIAADGTGYTSDAVRALNYAVANGAKVANASWGGNGFDASLANAISRARNSGTIFVAAAGNEGKNNDATAFYPASYITTSDNVVTVAATDTTDRLASFSNRGAATVTLGAPGASILSTLPNNRYGQLSGTSMATPFVSGAIALLWDANPTWTYRQVIDKLKQSVDPLTTLSGQTITGGRINVAKLLDVATPVTPPNVPPPTVLPPTTTRETVGARVTVAVFHGTAPQSFDRVRVTFNEKINAGSFTIADVTLNGPTGAFPALSVTPVSGTNNTQFDIAFAAKTALGTYSVTIGVDVFDIAANRLNQNGNSVNGEATDRFIGTGMIAANDIPSAPATNLPAAIPDAGTLEIPIVVNQDGAIADVNVKLFIEHQNVGDLVLQLRSPGGRTITLAERRGGAGSGFRGTTLDDEAKSLISKSNSPFPGSFRPEESLAAFDGQPARGTWTLIVIDRSATKTGRVTAATLDIATTSVLAPSVRTLAFEEPPMRFETQQLLGQLVVPLDLSAFLGLIREWKPESPGTAVRGLSGRSLP